MKQTRSTFRESNRQLAMETSKSANFKMQSVKDLRVSGLTHLTTTRTPARI
jgi:hypothetical protein